MPPGSKLAPPLYVDAYRKWVGDEGIGWPPPPPQLAMTANAHIRTIRAFIYDPLNSTADPQQLPVRSNKRCAINRSTKSHIESVLAASGPNTREVGLFGALY